MFKPARSRLLILFLLLIAITLMATAFTSSGRKWHGARRTVKDVELLGMVTFPTGTMFEDTEVGGLSGITYDRHRKVYYALSDDRTDARFYNVAIDLSDGTLDDGDVAFEKVTGLTQRNGDPFEPGSLDPEGIEYIGFGKLYISSEGDADASPPIDPFVNRFNLWGREKRALPVPDKFLPDGNETFGIRDNLAFESLTSTPVPWYLYTATENALHQDGPPSTLDDYSPSRVLEYKLWRNRPRREFVYCVQPIPKDSDPPGVFADNGLVEMQSLDHKGTFLAMERSFAVGVGNTVVLFETSLRGATNVQGFESLPTHHDICPDRNGGGIKPMSKEVVVNIEDLGVDPDNLEGMAFGPTMPDGRLPLIIVSDNNFNPGQTTQFIAVAVELDWTYH